MRIVLTAHAALMMRERDIALEWIEQTLMAPDSLEPDAFRDGVMRAYRALPERDNRILRVAYVQEDNTYRVITAFLDRGRRR
jgi:DNA-directed RNA polymerase specialized sigma subunit